MGVEDIKRQKVNVEKIKLLGADVIPVKTGTGTLKEAVDEAFKFFLKNKDVYYLVGSAVGPAVGPPVIVGLFVISGEGVIADDSPVGVISGSVVGAIVSVGIGVGVSVGLKSVEPPARAG